MAVGLSGGVDSSVAAAMLVEAGYDVTGVFLECWRAPGCRAEEDRKDALAVALKLEIPFKVLDFRDEYKKKVVDYFYREYELGRTPNPDTVCNREIKFGLFYEWAIGQAQGKPARFDYVATGHYARIKQVGSKYCLQRGRDTQKDQSYFLYQLKPEQLGKILFPIGEIETKEMVRERAKEYGLETAGKPDSQGICFMGEINVRDFLKERLEQKVGELVVDVGGTRERVGEHEGAWFYTIGQRVGKGLDKRRIKKLKERGVIDWEPRELPPLYVVGKNVEKNQLMIGEEVELERDKFEVEEMNWLVSEEELASNMKVWVRIRNLGELVEANVARERGSVKVQTPKPLRGVAPGQACVFYDGKDSGACMIGGGVIRE